MFKGEKMRALVTNLAMIKGVKAINEEIINDIDKKHWIIITWLSLILLGGLFLTIEKLYRELVRCITPLDGTEEENHYLLVITTSIRQLSLVSAGNDLGESSTAPPGGDTFWDPHMVAVPSGSTRVVSYQGTIMKELEE